jgi:hypothetical protein
VSASPASPPAVAAVRDEAVVEAESLRARSLVALLTTLRTQIPSLINEFRR